MLISFWHLKNKFVQFLIELVFKKKSFIKRNKLGISVDDGSKPLKDIRKGTCIEPI